MENSLIVEVGQVNTDKYSSLGVNAVKDVASRAGKEGQFLNWIGTLPENQIKTLDSLFDLADKAKNGQYTELAILGIGGSRHTTEALLKMLGKDSKVHFYSSVDPESFKRFASTLDLNKTQFLVVSKSGGTLETTVAYENSKKLMQEFLGKEDVSDRFIAMTDASSEKSALRRIVDSNEIKLAGFVHDDVGGRFSIFDDATIFTLAYIGESKEDVKAMLEASIKAQLDFSQTELENNDALKQAIFNVNSKESGKNKHFVEYFGDAYLGTTLWEKQLKNESLKATISTDTNVGPGYLHYNAEADLDPNNTDSFFTFVYVKPEDKVTTAVIEGVVAAYSAQHPVSKIEFSDLEITTIARFIEFKHFETLYTGNILRQLKGDVTPQTEAMPEVLQPNVEIYKKEVKKAMQK